ncbi:histone-fold-containing protein [Wallemia mellicola]|uniref:Histone-fold-containing protein n=2 Tax=Wallemia mellicola TaxID=1708541 RepID=A0A4T0PFZ6_9BASI|nr:histone-fold-containing protein [Wallemia mellicola CBS 633.66]TIB73192.1 hypothetical protein E3Q24_01288 [Wallemia mellicola]EIM21217.1 histone-fold-containing protein [Wallemia mellicola CBS 633.66]TIB82114.1 histone-fold-containing protein [Wallemia mellicola]TIB87745.1 histone-fold-containing protein [Wallemia mellicola]TIB90654.1 histone-fold-containing protein [Wallemia mellicola]|eukprot:XP_006958889.1 histone-fold-containing protein [Wallemia mellicola CBS 633.66]
MSDDEKNIPTASSFDDDLTLPKATAEKLIKEMLPPELTVAKETRDLLIECCVEFIHLVSSEANEACEQDSKKTISPEHVVSALKTLGFETYLKDMEEVLRDHKAQAKVKSAWDKERKGSRLAASGMTEEQLLAQQEELFAASKARMEASTTGPQAE